MDDDMVLIGIKCNEVAQTEFCLYEQKYYLKVTVKLGRLNVGPDHLCKVNIGEESTNIEEGLPDVKFFAIKFVNEQFLDTFQFLSTRITL